ncbi:MAG TPA: polysaccharide deacetylase family protein [Jatrophihabitans sp.]|nr:polysaccharide deacetylase family protein [Jatrophihabitans sp.]
MSDARRTATMTVFTAAAGHIVPSVATVAPLRRHVTRRLSDELANRQVSLTFDDGPDPESTPSVLDALSQLRVRATFFVLGEQLARHPDLARRIAAGGHGVEVHGWTHRPHLLRSPLGVADELRRTMLVIEATTGRTPRFWRPPHGIVTGGGVAAGRLLGLRLALWSADGLDWRRDATPDSIRDRVLARIGPGGIVLLHDSSRFGAPGSWQRTLAALPGLVEHCRTRGWTVGPLGTSAPDAASQR